MKKIEGVSLSWPRVARGPVGGHNMRRMNESRFVIKLKFELLDIWTGLAHPGT